MGYIERESKDGIYWEEDGRWDVPVGGGKMRGRRHVASAK